MKDVAKILATIYGRQPSQSEIDQVRSIASVLKISGNDEFMMFLACLAAYRNIFERIPELTVKKVQEAAKLAEESATQNISKLMTAQKLENDRIVTRMTEIMDQQSGLAEAMNEAENKGETASAKEKAAWICGTAIICLLLMGAAMFTGFKLGEKSGLAQARKEVSIPQKYNMWKDTPSFKMDK